jgi:NADH dehydrogenase/NADH:ubiquinone oxidoreductase subunit G
MCIVEIEGARGYLSSCITMAQEGMVVRTNTKDLIEARRTILDLIISSHNRDCLTCVRNQNCELQTLAEKFGITEVKYEGQKVEKIIDDFSDSIVRDTSKCILCKRCVSACKNIQTIGAIDVAKRGFESRISPALDESLKNVNCTLCGQCIVACPVGALREKDEIKYVVRKIKEEGVIPIVQTAPAVRVALRRRIWYAYWNKCDTAKWLLL